MSLPNPTLATAPTGALEAARERVVRLLTDRYADDTITVEEFERQLDALHATPSVSALTAMAAELERRAPSVPHAAQYVAPHVAPAYVPQPYAPAPAAYGAEPTVDVPRAPYRGPAPFDASPELRVLAVMSNTRRTPRGAVPRRIIANAVMSELIVDLRGAVWTHDCEVHVSAIMANVRVLLPSGVDAHVDVGAFMAAVNDRTVGRGWNVPALGVANGAPQPRVLITGTAIMAEVTVRKD